MLKLGPRPRLGRRLPLISQQCVLGRPGRWFHDFAEIALLSAWRGTVGEVNSERKHYGCRLLPPGKKSWFEIDPIKPVPTRNSRSGDFTGAEIRNIDRHVRIVVAVLFLIRPNRSADF